jgi:hypothetical protein
MRNTLLDRNPVAWLLRPSAERRQLIWAAAVIMGLAQATVLARSFDMLAALMTPVLLANIVLSPLFDFLLAWQAARLFADARRSGSLELLLVTPGFRRAALRGIRLSLQETFLKPVLFILGMRLLGGALALVFIDENSRRFAEQHSYFLFVLLGMLKEATGFLAIAFLGAWEGWRSPRAAFAAIKTFVIASLVPSLISLPYLGVIWLGMRGTAGWSFFWILAFGIIALYGHARLRQTFLAGEPPFELRRS